MVPRAARRKSLRTGDVARVIRECLRSVHGRIAVATVTAPGGQWSRAEVEEWNRGESAAWRRFSGRIRREMWRRHGEGPPVLLAWVAQRQGRGLDHLHLVFWLANEDHARRIREWVGIYRELHVEYGFGTVDDPFHIRRSRKTGKLQTMVFEDPGRAGSYLGNYLAGGQLERFVQAEDRCWRPYWISPTLMSRAGWSLRRCHWIRQAHVVSVGLWAADGSAMARLSSRLPSWWHDGAEGVGVLGDGLGWCPWFAAGGPGSRRGHEVGPGRRRVGTSRSSAWWASAI